MSCDVFDGNEHCCLVVGHSGPHMGRWYTMSATAIEIQRAKDRPNELVQSWKEYVKFQEEMAAQWKEVADVEQELRLRRR